MIIALALLLLQAQVVVTRLAVTVPVDPPAGLSAQAITQRRFVLRKSPAVALNWRPSPDLATPARAGTGYYIYRATGSGSFMRLAPGVIAICAYSDKTVKGGVAYRYYATAAIRAVESKPSNAASVTPR